MVSTKSSFLLEQTCSFRMQFFLLTTYDLSEDIRHYVIKFFISHQTPPISTPTLIELKVLIILSWIVSKSYKANNCKGRNSQQRVTKSNHKLFLSCAIFYSALYEGLDGSDLMRQWERLDFLDFLNPMWSWSLIIP